MHVKTQRHITSHPKGRKQKLAYRRAQTTPPPQQTIQTKQYKEYAGWKITSEIGEFCKIEAIPNKSTNQIILHQSPKIQSLWVVTCHQTKWLYNFKEKGKIQLPNSHISQ